MGLLYLTSIFLYMLQKGNIGQNGQTVVMKSEAIHTE